MKIYIAAPYPTRDAAIGIMIAVEAKGHTVTSRWLKAPDEMNDAFAREDLADIDACDLLLAYNPPEFENAGTGGRHVEFGYVIFSIINASLFNVQKRVALIGKRSNIFHHLTDVRVFDTLEAFLAMLENTEEV